MRHPGTAEPGWSVAGPGPAFINPRHCSEPARIFRHRAERWLVSIRPWHHGLAGYQMMSSSVVAAAPNQKMGRRKHEMPC